MAEEQIGIRIQVVNEEKADTPEKCNGCPAEHLCNHDLDPTDGKAVAELVDRLLEDTIEEVVRQREHRTNALFAVIDTVAEKLFGMTRTEAHRTAVCIDCKKPIRELGLTPAQIRQWKLDAMCPACNEERYRKIEEVLDDEETV